MRNDISKINGIKVEMEKNKLDALLSLRPTNTYYLTGFNAIFYSRPIFTLLSLDDDPIMIIPFIRENRAREKSWVKDIVLYGDPGITILPTDPLSVLKDIIEDRGLVGKNIGIEEDFLTVDFYDRLRKALPTTKFVSSSTILRKSRMIKDKEEIKNIAIAAELTDIGMEAAVQAIRERKTEIEACNRSEDAMKEHWSKYYPYIETCDFGGQEGGIYSALWCNILSGSRMMLLSTTPSGRKIQNGDLVMVKVFTVCNGYHAENERLMVIGKPTNKQKKTVETMLESRQKALEVMLPGQKYNQVSKVVRAVFEKAGYRDEKIRSKHREGHNIGLGHHEPPSIAESEDTTFQPGMVVTLEPSIYVDQCRYGHSDTLLITEKGHEFLTNYDRGLITI